MSLEAYIHFLAFLMRIRAHIHRESCSTNSFPPISSGTCQVDVEKGSHTHRFRRTSHDSRRTGRTSQLAAGLTHSCLLGVTPSDACCTLAVVAVAVAFRCSRRRRRSTSRPRRTSHVTTFALVHLRESCSSRVPYGAKMTGVFVARLG